MCTRSTQSICAATSKEKKLAVGEITGKVAIKGRPTEQDGEEANADDADVCEADSDPPSSDSEDDDGPQ